MATEKTTVIPDDIRPEDLIGRLIERDGVIIRVYMIRYFQYTIMVHPRDNSGYYVIGYTFAQVFPDGKRGKTDWKFVPKEETYVE